MAEAGPCNLGLCPVRDALGTPCSQQMGDGFLGPKERSWAEHHSIHYKHIGCKIHPEFRNVNCEESGRNML